MAEAEAQTLAFLEQEAQAQLSDLRQQHLPGPPLPL